MSTALELAQPEPSKLTALLVEYERLNTNVQNSMGRVFTIMTLGAGALGLVISQVPSIQDTTALRVLYVALPLAFTLTFAMLVEQLYFMVFVGYQLRSVAERLKELTGEEKTFAYIKAEARGLYNPVTAPPKRILSYVLIFSAISGAYLGLVAYCIAGMIHEDLSWPIIVLSVAGYAVATIVALVAFHGTQSGLKKTFDDAIEAACQEKKEEPREYFPFLPLIGYLILPRPFDLVLKSTYFGIGMIGALVAARVDDKALIAVTDQWSMLLLAFLGFEVLFNQAKLMANDLRDREDDADRETKKGRLLASYLTGAVPHIVAPFCILRAVAGALLVAFVFIQYGIWTPIPCVAAMLVLQAAYEFYSKKNPPLRIALLVPTYGIRTALGFVLVGEIIGIGTDVAIAFGSYMVLWAGSFALMLFPNVFRAEAQEDRRPGKDKKSWYLGREYLYLAAALSLSAVSCLVVAPFMAVGQEWTWWALVGVIPNAAMLPIVTLDSLHRRHERLANGSRWKHASYFDAGLLKSGMGLALLVGAIATVLTVIDSGHLAAIWSVAFPLVNLGLLMLFTSGSYAAFLKPIDFKELGVKGIVLYFRAFRLPLPRLSSTPVDASSIDISSPPPP